MTSKVQRAADYRTVDRENLGTRLCVIFCNFGERKNKERNGEIPLTPRGRTTHICVENYLTALLRLFLVFPRGIGKVKGKTAVGYMKAHVFVNNLLETSICEF